jgi:hypothetical protein
LVPNFMNFMVRLHLYFLCALRVLSGNYPLFYICVICVICGLLRDIRDPLSTTCFKFYKIFKQHLGHQPKTVRHGRYYNKTILDNLDTIVQNCSGVALSLCERRSDPPSGTDGTTTKPFWTLACLILDSH